MVTLDYFNTKDFQQLINWIPNEAFCFQWCGPAFHYPLSKEQLQLYITDANQYKSSHYVFKAIDNKRIIGHISISQIDYFNKTARIGKVLIGNVSDRGKNYGEQLMIATLLFAYEVLQIETVSLGVFDFNTSAIACYKKVGFQIIEERNRLRLFQNQHWLLIEMELPLASWYKAHKLSISK